MFTTNRREEFEKIEIQNLGEQHDLYVPNKNYYWHMNMKVSAARVSRYTNLVLPIFDQHQYDHAKHS